MISLRWKDNSLSWSKNVIFGEFQGFDVVDSITVEFHYCILTKHLIKMVVCLIPTLDMRPIGSLGWYTATSGFMWRYQTWWLLQTEWKEIIPPCLSATNTVVKEFFHFPLLNNNTQWFIKLTISPLKANHIRQQEAHGDGWHTVITANGVGGSSLFLWCVVGLLHILTGQ